MRLVLASALVLVCFHILIISSGAARPRQGASTVRQQYDVLARHRERYHDRDDEPYRKRPEPHEKKEYKYEHDDEQQKLDNEEEEEETYEEQPKQQEHKEKEYTAQPCPDSKQDCPTPQPPDQVKQGTNRMSRYLRNFSPASRSTCLSVGCVVCCSMLGVSSGNLTTYWHCSW